MNQCERAPSGTGRPYPNFSQIRWLNNIQATRDFVMYLRGEVIGQPYLVLIDKDE